MKRPVLSLCLLLMLFSAPLLAQKSDFPEGLRKLTQKEMMNLPPDASEGLPEYGPNGERWSEEKTHEMTAGMKFIPEFYADKDGKLAAIKFRKITAQEEAMFARFAAEQKRLAAMVGTEAKGFETVDMNGNKVDLADLRGSVVAINFWYVGCKPCVMEMPELNEIVKEFEGKPVKFVAIALDKKPALEAFLKKKDFDYDIVPEGKTFARLYEITGYPTHCIVDQEGKIAYFKSAYSPRTAAEITATIEKLLH